MRELRWRLLWDGWQWLAAGAIVATVVSIMAVWALLGVALKTIAPP